MTTPQVTIGTSPERIRELLRFVWKELAPKGSLLTPFNIISLPLILLGLVLIVIRFAYGLGAVTNLSQAYPWGLWIGFDVITGVAFAGGAYVLTFMVYILGMKQYQGIVRATVLNGFLAYAFYAGALLLDLGRPWNIVNPIIGNGFGYSSVLFLVAWHFLLYMAAELLEFSPVIAEWLGLKRARKILAGLTVGAVIFGVTLSTLHQSGLGALFLMAKGKIHPLWYTEFIPVLFFWSSIFAGLSMVIVEGSISHKVFHDRLSSDVKGSNEKILLGLSRICGVAMFGYLFMKVLVLVHDGAWAELGTSWGAWYLVEVIGFVAVPMWLFLHGAKIRNLWMIRGGAAMTLIGIILNRLNISLITFKWYAVDRYYPTWEEVAVTAAILLAEIWVFRWVINRMPVLSESPKWAREQGH